MKYHMPCFYQLAYTGMCCKPVFIFIDRLEFCEEHEPKKCACGEKAVRDCATTEAFCLLPLCVKCECKHGT